MLTLAITIEVAREICFKLAANRSEKEPKRGGYLLNLFGTPFLWLGFLCRFIEIFVWIKVLSSVPLNIAFPLISLCYCGMILGGKYILKETVSPRKWTGMFLITLGVAVVGSQGVG